MKSKTKKIFSVLLTVLTLFTYLSVYASAADAKAVLSFRVTDDGYAKVYDCDESAQGVLSVPTETKINSKTYKVKCIGDRAFDKCKSLTDIRIPEGVTTIGSQAFRNCSSLRNVYIPESLIRCEFDAFSGCKNITVHCYMANYQFVNMYGSYQNIIIDIIDKPEADNNISSDEEQGGLLDDFGILGRFVTALKEMISEIMEYFGVNDEDDFSIEDLPIDLPFDIPFDIFTEEDNSFIDLL